MLIEVAWTLSDSNLYKSALSDCKLFSMVVQIASLMMQNKLMIIQLQQAKKDPSIIMSCDNRGSDKEFYFPKHDLNTAPCATESKEEVTVLSAAVTEVSSELLDCLVW